ncbi:MAG: hypothetical protein Q8S42_03145, partial [Archangium sp.]|nr:hypothetical protein [Archangium sp.]
GGGAGGGGGSAAGFDLVFNGTGYSPHNGQTVRMALVQQSDGGVLNTQSLVVANGNVNFTFTGLLQSGAAYNVDYYADVNGNNQCGGNDHIWREVVPAVTANVTLTQSHNFNFVSAACNSFP